MGFLNRLQHAWSVFTRDPTVDYINTGPGSSFRPDRPRMTKGNERTIATSVYNRIALDVANISIYHCKVDDNNRFVERIDSSLNYCLNVEANVDQTGRAFIQDAVMSMLDEGHVCLIPVQTSYDPTRTGSYNIEALRTGKVIEWFPKKVRVRCYDENTGVHKDVLCLKQNVAIIENPFFSVMNEPNSTLQRLIHKLSILDAIDEQSSVGKLDLIIQLPYTIKTDARRLEAEKRRNDIIEQIKGPLGIAYVDGTEKVIQLNRPLENNLLSQIEYLTNLFWTQMGMTQEILNGTADEKTMLNYNNRIIEPIVAAITHEIRRKFLTKKARTQKQTIKYFIEPFKLTPASALADFADKLTRNEVLTSNEVRQIMGFVPASDPKADELRNSTMYHPDDGDTEELSEENKKTDLAGAIEALTDDQREALKQLFRN